VCSHAFPRQVTNETRHVCRMYQGQVVEPLLRIESVRTRESALIKASAPIHRPTDQTDRPLNCEFTPAVKKLKYILICRCK
jgi:hypothetical protein